MTLLAPTLFIRRPDAANDTKDKKNLATARHQRKI